MDALTFQTEVRRIEKLMYRVGMSYLGNNDDVADAVQDALAKAWEKRNHLKKLEQFKPWMMRILTNRCICYAGESCTRRKLQSSVKQPEQIEKPRRSYRKPHTGQRISGQRLSFVLHSFAHGSERSETHE